MTKITCLGDSIRMQYTPVVKKLLGEEFEVFAPAENCRYSKFTLRGLFDWEKDMAGSRIVHWNNGLWDFCNLFGDGAFADEEEYVKTMLRIADLLKSRHEIVIFATTTPVSPLNKYNKNEIIRHYNEIIVPLLEARGILINDLHSLVADDLDRYVSTDRVHLSEEAIPICAEAVANAIRAAASTLPVCAQNTEETLQAHESGAPVVFGGK